MAPKKPDDRAERPTDPPPPTKKERATVPPGKRGEEARSAVIRTGKPIHKAVKRKSGAAIEEVVADLSRDPRRERDEDE
jgi:hypothetical protein